MLIDIKKGGNMQNIQVICEKILQGPKPQVALPLIQMDTSFMELMKTLTQNLESKEINLVAVETSDRSEELESTEVTLIQVDTSDQYEEIVHVNEKLVQGKVEVNEEAILQVLNQFWLNKNPSLMIDEPQILKDGVSKVDLTVSQNQLSKAEYNVKDYELLSNMKFELNEEVVKLSPEKFVIETVDKNEIHEHFKMLNQTTKLKEVVKNEEAQSINFTVKQDHEVLKSHEIELNDVQMNEFKQSIDEMKGLIEQMSKKDDQTIIFKLKPEGLAEIVIKFEQKLGKVVLDISTSNRMVEQLIQKELPQLRDSLKSYQMEVNLNEMSYKNQSEQSRQPKYYQERQVFELVEEESMNDEWVFVPHSYGFNTYV